VRNLPHGLIAVAKEKMTVGAAASLLTGFPSISSIPYHQDAWKALKGLDVDGLYGRWQLHEANQDLGAAYPHRGAQHDCAIAQLHHAVRSAEAVMAPRQSVLDVVFSA
jgi:hypothetical protein